MRKALIAACMVVTGFVVTAGVAPATGDVGGAYDQADAGSLGLTNADPASTYCAADAGTLGHPDPVDACRMG